MEGPLQASAADTLVRAERLHFMEQITETRVWQLMEGHLDLEPVLCRNRLQLESTFVYFSGPENYCLNAGRTMLMGPSSWRRFKSG